MVAQTNSINRFNILDVGIKTAESTPVVSSIQPIKQLATISKEAIESVFPGIRDIRKSVEQQSLQPIIAGQKEQFAKMKEDLKTPEGMMNFALSFGTMSPAKGLNKTADTALSKLVNAVRGAKPVRKEIEKLASLERGKRIGQAAGILEKVEGEKAFIQAKGKLKGELVPEKPRFEQLRGEQLGQGDIDTLFIQIQRHPELTPFDKISTADGLSKILSGEIPQPSKLSLLEDVFGKELIEETMKKRPFGQKLKDIFTEAINVPRSLIASFDMSAVFRQGIVFTTTKPFSAIKASKEMFRQVFSERNYTQWFSGIKKDPLFNLMKESDLYIADSSKISGGLAGKEERFMSNFAQKIPLIGSLVRASERAYTSYLNKLRVDVFANTTRKFIKEGFDPKENPEIFKALAGFINNATGRGDLGRLGRNAQLLNTLFFSPRLIASRFNLLNPVWYEKQPTPVRKEAIKTLAEFVGIGTTILTLSKLAGADVEYDPRSTDFGKIRIGNTRWDIWGGFQQWVRVISQLASGERKTQKKEIIPLSKKKFPFETRLDVGERFVRGKLAPVPSLALELFEGQKLFGEELKVSQETYENTIPLYLQDIKEAFNQIGPWAMITVGAPAFFGVGVQTYEEKRLPNRFNP